MSSRRWNKVRVAAVAVIVLSVATVGYASQMPAIGTNTAPNAIIAPTQVSLPPVAAEALQMSEAGMSDDVIVSYIQKSASSYALDAQQIIYLHDLGVSSAVLNALVDHGGTIASDQTAEISGELPSTADASSASATPVNGAAADFYNALVPYGTWVDVPAYGWCWQPTVVVVNPAWQPYCNNGCWLWTDQGWYWTSYYSWGWAPFHYGRWCRYPGYGWLWCPGKTWGPAWVCWRDYPGYCGWAPLPPGAYLTAGVGWTFNGLVVGVNFGFGLGPQCFTFCDYRNFCRRHPFNCFWHGRDAGRFFDHSKVNNDFAFDAHRRFINRGIAVSRIESATHAPIQPVAVRDLPNPTGHVRDFVMPDRLTRAGNAQVIYRPDRDISVAHNRFQVENDSPSENYTSSVARHGFTTSREMDNTPRFQTGRQNNIQHSGPNVSWNQTYGNTFERRWEESGNSQANRSSPTLNYHRDYSDSGRFTSNYHPAPTWHSKPTYHSAQSWHSASAWHASSSHSWGGETHLSGGSTHFGSGMASNGGFHR